MRLRAYTVRAIGLNPEPRSLLRNVHTTRAAQAARVGTDWDQTPGDPIADIQAMIERTRRPS